MEKIGTDYKQRRLQNSRFRKAGSALSVILECEARESHTPASLAVFSLVPAFRSNVVRRSRSQKIRLFCSLQTTQLKNLG